MDYDQCQKNGQDEEFKMKHVDYGDVHGKFGWRCPRDSCKFGLVFRADLDSSVVVGKCMAAVVVNETDQVEHVGRITGKKDILDED